MLDPISRADPYASENLRFRKAYIRERLAILKLERDTLLEERETITKTLASRTSEGPAKAPPR